MKLPLSFLQKLGLSETEAKTYITLLELGPLTVSSLAQKLRLNRTALYTHIHALLEQGIIHSIIIEGKKHLVAIDPSRLQSLLDKKVLEIQSLQQQFPSIVSQLENTPGKSDQIMRIDIKYFKGVNGLKEIWEEMFESSEVRIYSKLSEIAPLFPDEQNLFDKALKRNPKLKIYEIYGDSFLDIRKHNYTSSSPRYFHKFMPANFTLNSPGILMFDNKVAVINADEKLNGTVLYNKNYYLNSINLFDYIWQTLP